MDLSGMIFVALAVAWAVYLVPKALRHHDEVARSRSVDRFSDTMRVLARREPVSRRAARLVVTPGRTPAPAEVSVKGERPAEPLTPAEQRVRREATRRATARRRHVLAVLLLGNAVVAVLAAVGIFGWTWQAIPGGLVVVWLVLCRVMVKSERAAAVGVAPVVPVEEDETDEALPADYTVERNDQGFDEVGPTAETATMPAIVESALWDPLPVTLPTYVGKPAAVRRSVRTIDLGQPGAWTSGHTEESAAIAREAEAADAAARATREEEPEQRAVGS